MFSNLAVSLLRHEQIITTKPKAKELRGFTDKMITLGKRGDLHSRRAAMAFLNNTDIVGKVFGSLADRYRTRKGGYTRVLSAGFRYGDSAAMAVIELVDRDAEQKGAEDRARVEALDDAEASDES